MSREAHGQELEHRRRGAGKILVLLGPGSGGEGRGGAEKGKSRAEGPRARREGEGWKGAPLLPVRAAAAVALSTPSYIAFSLTQAFGTANSTVSLPVSQMKSI